MTVMLCWAQRLYMLHVYMGKAFKTLQSYYTVLNISFRY